VLGVIKQGTVKKYNRLKLMPGGKDILIKSIQLHDEPVQESKSPARVGLLLKEFHITRFQEEILFVLPMTPL
jgi:selenocysteine-specific translation elongation factor